MKIGFLVNDLGPSELNYFLCRNANAFLARRPRDSVALFYENICRPAFPAHFAVNHVSEAYGLAMPLVATSLATAERLLGFPKATPRVFYCWDLEWTRLGVQDYRTLQAVYGNRRLPLWARGREHAEIIASCWNRPSPGVVDAFNFDDIEREISLL